MNIEEKEFRDKYPYDIFYKKIFKTNCPINSKQSVLHYVNYNTGEFHLYWISK